MTIPSGSGDDRRQPAVQQDAAATAPVAAAPATVEDETSIETDGNHHTDSNSNAAASAAAAPPAGAEASIATNNQDDKFRSDRAARILRRNDNDADVVDRGAPVDAAIGSSTSKFRTTTTTSNGTNTSTSSDHQQQQPGAFAVTGMSGSANSATAEGPADPEDADAEGMESLDDSANVTASATVSSSQQQQHGSPEAEEEESVPVLVAELVQPPIEALKVVFDEDSHDHGDVESHVNRFSGSSTGARTESALEKSKDRSRRRCVWGIITVVLILCIVIPLVLLFQKDQDEEKAAGATSAQVSGDEEEELLATFPYECYRSTMRLLIAQYENPEQNRFIMCPNTRIQLGVMNDPANGDYNIGNGDIMIMITRENVEVTCGDDGRVENNCVLDGGFVQVLLQQGFIGPNEDLFYETARTVDNTTIRGMTFTGELFKDPFVGGSSIVMSHKGQNIRLIDCVWENMTAPDGLVFAGVNPYQTSSAGSEFGCANNFPGEQEIEVKIENCTFRNISYGGGPLIVTNDQRITVENCRFSDIRLSSFVNFCDNAFVSNAQEVDRWCMSLFSCNGPAYCEISDICVNDFEYAGRAGILSASYGAEIVVQGTNLVNSVHASYVNETDTCTGGFSWYRSTQLPSSCMNMTEMDGTIEFDTSCFS